MKITPSALGPVLFASAMALAACGGSTNESSVSVPASTENTSSDSPSFAATLGSPVAGYGSLVDLAVRTADGTSTTYVVEQAGTIRIMERDGRPGPIAADLTLFTRENGEQGLLGLVFSPDGATAYVNYTDRKGRTTIVGLDVAADGTFDITNKKVIYTLDQPYPNHNGGDLVMSPDGRYLFAFHGDGGAAGDPDRDALDPTTDLGKIVRIDLEADYTSSVWASGLRNPWRVYLDPVTNDLWIGDVGQDTWEEIDVVPLNDSQGVSFGWSAYEGTEPFNADQTSAHEALRNVSPIHTYRHENDDCSIAGGAVYHGSKIPTVGTWYVFSDFCSGRVQALCSTPERTSCGVVDIGRVPQSVAVLPDAEGELWVLSHGGEIVPLIAQ